MRQITGTTIISFLDNELGHMVVGACESVGSGLPTTTLTFSRGCVVTDRSTGLEWTNTGTSTTPSWVLSNDPQEINLSLVALTPASIIDTTANIGLSSTDGVILIPAPAAGFVNVWHRTIVSYTFGTAAYAGGGNTTVNIAGGAALSGLIATTTLWQNASSIIQEFVPLSTVAFPITAATAIKLKTASAVTNPGTAAGTAKVYSWYSTVAI